jgi:molecular chaperone DnaK
LAVSEKTLKDAGDKAKPEDKAEVESKVASLKEVKDKDDVDAIRKAVDELSSAIQKVGAAMYESSAEATADKATETTGDAASADKGPVDAEFKEVKEEGKEDAPKDEAK